MLTVLKSAILNGGHAALCPPTNFPRHCERSEAIHSAASGNMDCFVALLPCTNASRLSQAMTVDIPSPSRDADRPKFAGELPPSCSEGAGKTGCTPHPRSRVQFAHKNAHTSIQVQAETLRPSLRNGFTAYSVLSPVNGSFATVAAQGMNPTQLDASTAASGPHDLMSSDFFGLLKTAEAPENKGIFCLC